MRPLLCLVLIGQLLYLAAAEEEETTSAPRAESCGNVETGGVRCGAKPRPDPDPEQLALDDVDMITMIMEGMHVSTVSRLDSTVVEGIPADSVARIPPDARPLENPSVTRALYDKKTAQTSVETAKLLSHMTRSELHILNWDMVMAGMSPEGMAALTPGTAEKMPWDKVMPHITPEMARLMTAPVVKAMPASAWQYATPQLIGGLSPATFGEVPVASLNQVPVQNFKYVSVNAWRQLGPRRFSQLKSSVVYQISRKTYEYLGRPFLSRVDKSRLSEIEAALPDLPPIRPPTIADVPPLASQTRPASEKLRDAIVGQAEVAKHMRADEDAWLPEPAAHPIQEKFTLDMPGSAAHRFSTQARESLQGDEYWWRRHRFLQSTARTLLQEASANDLASIDWNEVAPHLDGNAYNAMSQEQLATLPWESILPNMSPEAISTLSPRTVQAIPVEAFRGISSETFNGLSTAALQSLTVEHMKVLSVEVFEGMRWQQVNGLGPELINVLARGIRRRRRKRQAGNRVALLKWQKVFAEARPSQVGSFTELLSYEVIQKINWHTVFAEAEPDVLRAISVRVYEQVPADAFADLSDDGLGALPPDFWQVMKVEQLQYIQAESFSGLQADQFIRMSPEIMQAMTKKQIQNVKWTNVISNQIDWNAQEYDFVQAAPPRAFKFMTYETVTGLSQDTWYAVTAEQSRMLNWAEFFPQMSGEQISMLSDTAWEGIPTSLMKGMTEEQFRGITKDGMRNIPARHLHKINSEYWKIATMEQLVGAGPKKLGEAGVGQILPIERIVDLGEPYARALGRYKDYQAYFRAKERAVMVVIVGAIEETNGVKVHDALMALNDDQWKYVSWKRVGRTVKCYQVNQFPAELIERMPWQDVLPMMSPSTVECLHSDVWRAMPAKAVASLSAEQVASLNPATVALFSVESLEAMDIAVFEAFSDRTMLRMPAETIKLLSVERLNAVPATSYRLVRVTTWEEVGVERFTELDQNIRNHVPVGVREKVSYMSEDPSLFTGEGGAPTEEGGDGAPPDEYGSNGEYPLGPDGEPALGPDGEPIYPDGEYPLGPDGEPVGGVDGELPPLEPVVEQLPGGGTKITFKCLSRTGCRIQPVR